MELRFKKAARGSVGDIIFTTATPVSVRNIVSPSAQMPVG